MKRDTLYLNAESFTTMSACVREVLAILEATAQCTDECCEVHGTSSLAETQNQCVLCKIVVRANPKQREELESELEPIKQQWRVKVEEVA